ncbi:nascent polypeptide-associated complex subunit alpha, muscle-specific form isoform X2 [Episyrphus balteatus]|uniref:nascent polypeptide-associated complex subunit alpha, muscle-specific form isoform X2 n=1 Tax=Episyrphus balteatus TaxID=286459 RepID=UPI0024863ED6|nr:nascent polypeptide-associated complex subunit alpha, muscle-specific form isoform X2 [Episyrphus balteatus]
MSERSKGDTSSSSSLLSTATAAGRVVKNPLLSASVTGLTFDDFQNKPLLLPAAPPIKHPTPPPPVVSRESTPLVTVGKSSDIDTENLSEINLNDTSATSSSNIADTSDENSNSLIESTNQIDNSILSQAASSFSQLPSVASSVFSTFSKKFNSGRVDDYNSNSQLDIQPFTTPFVGQSSVVPQSQILPPPSAFGNQQNQQQQQDIGLPPQNQPSAPVEPPTFYSPTEVPSVPSGPSGPPSALGQNTYRLSAKKKIYAQIPGLSSVAHQESSSLPPSTTGFPPPIGFESVGSPIYSEQPNYDKPEERKGGLFSLSNLGVPNVLQNLSGLVQSATGISQRPQEQALQSPYNPQTSQVNFTGIEPSGNTPVNFFGTQASLFNPAQAPPLPTGAPFVPFAEQQQGPGVLIPNQPPKGNTPEALFQPTSFRPPSAGNQFASNTGVLFQSQPPKSNTPEGAKPQALFQPATSSSRPPSVGNQIQDTNPSLKASAPQQPLQPELNSEKASAGPPPSLFGPPPSAASSSEPSSNFFGPPPTSTNNFPPPSKVSGSPANLFGLPRTSETNFSGPPPPPKSATPESNLVSQQASSASTLDLFRPPSTSGTPDLFRPPSTSGVNVAGPPPKSVTPDLFRPPSTIGVNVAGPPTVIPAQQSLSGPTPDFFKPPPTSVNLLGPSSVLQPVEPHQFSGSPTVGPLPVGPPTVGPPSVGPPSARPPSAGPPSAGPPSVGPPSTSFRLQKGTRLYKSPFAANSSEHHPQVPVSQHTFPPIPQATNYFNPQQAFVPPQGQPIQPQIPSQGFAPPSQGVAPPSQVFGPPNQGQPIQPLIPSQGFAPPNQGFAPPSQGFVPPPGPPIQPQIPSQVTAPPLSKPPQQPLGAVNFFNPQGFSSSQGILDPLAPAAPLNILEPTSAEPLAIPSKPPVETYNFFNPQALNSGPGLLDPTKEAPQAEIQQPVAISNEVSSINEPTEEVTPPSTLPVTETEVDNPTKIPEPQLQEQSSVTVLDQVQLPPSDYSSTITSKPEEETLNSLQEQQNNILPPPPAVNFGAFTPSKEQANFPPPPPHNSVQNKPSSNPYRKGLQSTHPQLPAPTSLSSFFTPIDQGNNFFQTINSAPNQEAANFFTETNSVIPQDQPVNPQPFTVNAPEQLAQEAPKILQENSTPLENQELQTELSETEPSLPIRESTPVASVVPVQSEEPEKPSSPPPAVANPLSFYKPDTIQQLSSNNLPVASKPKENSKIDSPLKSQDTPNPEPVPNLFTGFFDQAATAPTVAVPNPISIQRPSLPDPTTFFDSFSLVPTLGVAAPPSEDPNSQRIQNFFNNPPPKELDTVGDLNYNLVGSGLSVQNLQIRSLTPASNLAEPPSSSCSEFSELNSSLSAANRQPLIQAADSSKVSPEEEAIFESPEYQDLPEEIVNELKMANSMLGNSSPTNETTYKPAVKHWFYKRKLDVKCLWTPFSFHDSALLEEAFLKGDEGPNLVAVEGGRFDVNISERTKTPVYWEGEPIEVKRCSWFYKASDSKYVPYEEETADLLEEEYKKASESCEWHKKIPISAGDIVVFHGPTVIVHFQPQQQVDSWGGSTLDSENFLSYMKQQTITRPRVVKRDLDDFNIDEGESHKVDHLLFMVHGIGSACDLKMRSVEEVVDEFRSIALQLVQSHYKNSVESGYVGRVEVLPVSWHSELHSDELGIDEKLKSITLESIPKLRNFTNDTLLDILFYTSPMFCQRIINTVTASMNSIFVKYKQRNPEFHGGVSLAGHSLGSLIMFDLLCHQRPQKESEEKNMENPDEITSGFPVESSKLNEEAGQNITYKMGQAGTGQPFISYPQLLFQPKKFFALGSPIGMFVTIRGIDKLGLDFRLPTCPGFYNIFHPYDPVAYRLEALVNPDMNGIPPVLIPHHKGRKRMHLELKETMSRVGADLKQRFFETFKTTLDSVNLFAPKIKTDPKELEKEVDKAHQEQQTQQQSIASTSRSRANSNSTNQSDTDVIEIDFPLGKLNDSKRVDYVLQEAPLEFFNEYLFALSSHVCYWESEDTILFVMKQIYNGIGISPDSQVPQQTMTIERPSSSGGSTTQQSPTS